MWEYLIKSTRHLIMAFVMENWFKRMYCPFWLQLLQMYSEMKKSGLNEDGRRTNDLAGHPISRTKGRNWNINPNPLIPSHINAFAWHSQYIWGETFIMNFLTFYYKSVTFITPGRVTSLTARQSQWSHQNPRTNAFDYQRNSWSVNNRMAPKIWNMTAIWIRLKSHK